MIKRTKTIFISTFILIIIILFGVLFFIRRTKNNKSNNNGIIKNQPFNSFNNTNSIKNKKINGTVVNNGNGIKWINNNSNKQPKFYQITTFAVAGASFAEEPNPNISSSSTIATNTKIKTTNNNAPSSKELPVVRYVERQTGHIYQMNLNTRVITKISNTTIPSVHEVLFNNNAKSFIYRYLSTEDNDAITSFITSSGTGNVEFLPFNITNISLSPDKKSFFYLVKNSDNVTGFIKSFNENKTTQVFISPFADWLSQLLSTKNVFLTTKPSWRINGSLFSLNTKNETLTKILGGVRGLTTLANSNGSYVLYNRDTKNGPDLLILNTKNHTIKDLNLYTLPEKCTWGNDNIHIYCAVPNTIIGEKYPDSWYQGLVSFNDYFVKINPQTTQITTIANSINETPVDAIHLFLNKKESKLFFINKKDSTLWSLAL